MTPIRSSRHPLDFVPRSGAVTREERLSQVSLQLEEQQVRSRGLDGGDLAAYRAYTGGISSDIEAVSGLGPAEAAARPSGAMNVLPAPDQGVEPVGPQPPATAPPGGPEENFHLKEPADPNATPRYSPAERFREQALQAVEAECSAAFHGRGQEAQQAIHEKLVESGAPVFFGEP